MSITDHLCYVHVRYANSNVYIGHMPTSKRFQDHCIGTATVPVSKLYSYCSPRIFQAMTYTNVMLTRESSSLEKNTIRPYNYKKDG